MNSRAFLPGRGSPILPADFAAEDVVVWKATPIAAIVAPARRTRANLRVIMHILSGVGVDSMLVHVLGPRWLKKQGGAISRTAVSCRSYSRPIPQRPLKTRDSAQERVPMPNESSETTFYGNSKL